jgi:hypothetical protein
MLRNQQFVRGRFPEHFNAYQNRCQYHCVRAVHADRLDRAEAFSWLAVISGEGHIMPNVSRGTTGFQSTDDVALCQVLVFQAHG